VTSNGTTQIPAGKRGPWEGAYGNGGGDAVVANREKGRKVQSEEGGREEEEEGTGEGKHGQGRVIKKLPSLPGKIPMTSVPSSFVKMPMRPLQVI
jgi:hypothetical protein